MVYKRTDYHKKRRIIYPHRYWAHDTISNHRKVGFEINISIDELKDMAEHTPTCFICGCELKYGPGKLEFNSASLDRTINGEKSIDADNIQIICHRCNVAKGKGTTLELIEWCKEIASRYGD